ncbi:twin-arginine translocation signal domain-containing protein [Streptomyces sp. DH37]|uniref:WD40/YVTN/BNR-like repeat-containing protein n=1 Tax=Streptomyces sp. DH37 TaxID=3040122 RepID=UPI0024429C17|nr:twin-arginine translocation signal domain-containing protein [Streptomyces sp. DH37]MDG9705479.1 twin-arginine translocation signal domain-containing protein [Streptomyces sp. DH37]
MTHDHPGAGTPTTRRSVLRGTAAAAATAGLSAGLPHPAAHAAPRPSAAAGRQPYRWRGVAMGGTGFVSGILFHPRVRGLVYARTDIGGAYRWDDRAARWIPLTDHIGWDDWNLLGVEAVALDPAHPDRLYLALGTYAQPWASDGAVLRSDDRGATWRRADLPVKLGANEDGRGTGERLLVDPRDSAVLWLGTRHDGLWRSTDRGATWERDTSFPAVPVPTGQGVTTLTAAGRTLYAGWGDGGGTGPALYRTTADGGWEPVPGQPTGPATAVPQHLAHAHGVLYATYADAPGPNGQSDGAVHALDLATGRWSDLTPVRPGGDDTFGYAGLAVSARRPGTLVVSTNNRWAKVDTVFHSTDGGATWTSLRERAVMDVSETPYLAWGGEEPKFGWWTQALALDPYDTRHVLFGTGATIYGTRDLTHWAPRIRGLEEASVRKLISPPAGRARLLSALGDIGGFHHDTLTASPARGFYANPVFGTATGLDLAALRPSYVVRTGWGDGGNGALSRDGGRTWTPFATQPPPAKDAPGPIAVTADAGALIWALVHWDGTRYPAWRSQDHGATWTEIPTFPAGATPLADPLDPRTVYAYDTAAGTVAVSRDAGRTFTAAATGLPAGDREYQLAATPGRTGHLWLSAKENGLFRSYDGGRTFTRDANLAASHTLGFGKAAPGARHPAVYHVARLADSALTAVHRSDDGGRTWIRINDDAHQWGWTGQTITGDPRRHGRVYLGTNGRGVQYGDPL